MSNLETYLNAATRGLWGKRKLEVREELENHVLEQAHKLELQGFNQPEAIQKVLEQIGPANIVSQGMIGVHMTPTLIRTGMALLTLAATTFAVLSSTNAQVPRASITQVAMRANDLYINLTALTQMLQKAGIESSVSPVELTLTYKKKSTTLALTLENSWPSKDQREIRISYALTELHKIDVPIEYENRLDRIAYRINNQAITFSTTASKTQNWYQTQAQDWANTYLICSRPFCTGIMSSYEPTDIKPLPKAKLKGSLPQYAGRIISAAAYFNWSEKHPTAKAFLGLRSFSTKIKADGQFEIELPAGTYLLANKNNTGFRNNNKLEIAEPTQGVLLLGIRRPEWVQQLSKTHDLISFDAKQITLEASRTARLP